MPYPALHRMMALISWLFDALIVFVSSVNAHRQLFKARVDLDVTAAPHDQSFGSLAISKLDPKVTSYATEDGAIPSVPAGIEVVSSRPCHKIITAVRLRRAEEAIIE